MCPTPHDRLPGLPARGLIRESRGMRIQPCHCTGDLVLSDETGHAEAASDPAGSLAAPNLGQVAAFCTA